MFDKIKAWCDYSMTILWARIQLFVGAVWTVLISADLSPALQGKYLTYWLVGSGIITELARRRTGSADPVK